VALIIFFPAIVSSGLDKTEKVDLDKIQMQMNKEMQEAATPPAGAASGIEAMPNPAADQKAADEEQKKIDELFNKK
jgi:ribosomal protein L12E/L44/L45/RPP1/RPP2